MNIQPDMPLRSRSFTEIYLATDSAKRIDFGACRQHDARTLITTCEARCEEEVIVAIDESRQA